MAGSDDGDDFFSDDDLDDLPQNVLDDLENQAIQYTQYQATQALQKPPASDYGDNLDDDDLDDAIVVDEAQVAPTNRLAQFQQSIPAPIAQPHRAQANAGRGVVRPIADRSITPSQNNPQYKRPIPFSRSVTAGRSTQAENDGGSQLSQNAVSAAAADDVAHTLELQQLKQQIDQLKRDLLAKTGEVSVVRSKHERQVKEHERELIALRKLNAENIAKNQKAIEVAKEAEKTRATELEFVKRDLFEESEKVRSLRRQKERSAPIGEVTTPKKDRTSAFRDGFDDNEIQVLSPSKFAGRKSNQSSPRKAGAKRKRKGPESPAVPLEVAQDEPVAQQEATNAVVLDDAQLEKLRKPDDRLDFLETVLDHKIDRDHLKTLEEFTKFAFPSAPDESFTSLFLGKLPTLSTKQATSDFPIELCELIISLWSRCLTEKYYKPITLLLDLLTFALELRTTAIAPYILDTLLPTAQATCDLVAVPRFRRESYAKYADEIDVHACLTTMHLAALGCMPCKEHITRFWRQMRLDFVLMTLSQHQPVQDFDMMLQLLAMSVLKDSIGPIPLEPESQNDQIKYIIDRVAFLLVNSPVLPEGEAKHDAKTIAKLRLQIITTLTAFSLSPLGSSALAQHSHALGRITKCLSDSFDTLYSYPSHHSILTQTITKSIRLLHHLVVTHPEIDIQQKLSVVHGGSQKYLLALARLNFSDGEGGVLGAGIGEETYKMTLELLELAVTPEEGDAVQNAFVASSAE